MKAVRSIIIINIVVYIIGVILLRMEFPLYDLFGLSYIFSENHSTFQFLTSLFIHGGILHLVFNMIVFLSLGGIVEDFFGKKFIWFYLLCGIGAALAQMLFDQNSILIGASGSIYGVISVFALIKPNDKLLLFFIIPIKSGILIPLLIVYEIYASIFSVDSGVGHVAHIGGAFVGVVLYFLYKKYVLEYKV